MPKIETIKYDLAADGGVRLNKQGYPGPEVQRVFDTIHRRMNMLRCATATIVASDAHTVTVRYDA